MEQYQLAAVELENEYGYRWWTVMPSSRVDEFCAAHPGMLSDIDDVTPEAAAAYWLEQLDNA